MAANPILQAPVVDVPRHVWDAVNNAIHTSKIDGNLQPISLCYVAVRAAMEESAHRELLEALRGIVDNCADYEAWQRPCLAFDKAKAAIAKAEGL